MPLVYLEIGKNRTHSRELGCLNNGLGVGFRLRIKKRNRIQFMFMLTEEWSMNIFYVHIVKLK